MKDFIQILKRFLPPYKSDLIMSFVYNLLAAVFGVFSFAMMQPVLEILFNIAEPAEKLVPWEFTLESVKTNFYYYTSQVKLEYGDDSALIFVGIFLIIAVFLKVGFTYLGSYHTVGLRNGVVRDMRNLIYDKIVNLPIPFFTEEKKGDIIARSTGDVQEVENSVMNSLDMFIKNPVIIIVSLSAMIIMSPQLTLFSFILLPIAGFIIGRIGRSLKKTSRLGQNKMGDLLSTIEETLSGLRIIKAFTAEEKVQDKFEAENNDYRRIMNSLMRRRVLAHPVSEFLGTIVIVIVLWYGGKLILNGEGNLNGASFMVYLVLFYSIINPAKAFSKAFFSIQKGLAAMERIDQILDAESTIVDKESAKSVDTFEKSIEYRNVAFSYNGEKQVLKNINLEIPKGKTVALVGQSGSGKTTFVDLLPRFYDVIEGGIFVDGEDIRDCKITDMRNLMGNVNQESILFNDTIFNNIAFGVENATLEEVEAAAKIANAHDFITATEDGYHTNIGDRGGKLSGGQRQRLSIARAVLKNPPIMILDEATSALDTESERLVQDALDKLMQNRTSVVIAHRLSTVKNADLICVFHEGEIVERGQHDELIEKDGAYKKLYDMQLL
ncbi:ABC transporter ATP-binding protein/permease [Labilibaculum sp. DW002]|uniref:ABC transporter ATP-binding protein/permease n=1 Tax=Paralabilibaculum antarcticum TaxID=2912572 RepID=A0ABT5VUN7_9BACT|nr:ABC transporter ATP-binding protein [Labilibaculum sp. DW002]MDE5419011.1 ABC transporter ATP-binding protein/permease [Labilibaculum sp. DW002]